MATWQLLLPLFMLVFESPGPANSTCSAGQSCSTSCAPCSAGNRSTACPVGHCCLWVSQLQKLGQAIHNNSNWQRVCCACVTCPGGHYNPTPKSVHQLNTTAIIDHKGELPAPTSPEYGDCRACPAGKYSLKSTKNNPKPAPALCTVCKAGRYAEGLARQECTICAKCPSAAVSAHGMDSLVPMGPEGMDARFVFL